MSKFLSIRTYYIWYCDAQIGVSIASLCYYCGPVIVMILSPLLFKEKLTSTKIIGFLAVLIGIFLVNGFGAVAANCLGLLYGLASAIMYAFMAPSESAQICPDMP